MLDKIAPGDLLPGMTVIARGGFAGTVKICSVRFADHDPVMTDDYTDDLFYGDGDEEHDLDIMSVALPSGAVIWERPVVEVRVFEEELYDASISAKDKANKDRYSAFQHKLGLEAWFDSCNGKLASFVGANKSTGLCGGFQVLRAWTRELTAEERANWKGARK